MPYRLLVIEDNRSVADLVCRVAQELEFESLAICDFMEIASVYDNFLPDVIVLDILMPDMDGFEVLNFLHQRHSASHIIIMSGQANYHPVALTIAEGLKLPIFATIEKPFRIFDLRQILEKVKSSLLVSQKQNESFNDLKNKT